MAYIDTLVLDSRFRPHAIFPWERAVNLMIDAKVVVLAQYEEVLAMIDVSQHKGLRESLRNHIPTDCTRIEVKVPAVVQLVRKTPDRKKGVKFSPENVMLRDNFTCAYCRRKLPIKALNKDHVLPRAQGGHTTWTNVVASCYECNNKKGGRTPEQAGMKLWTVPTVPVQLPLIGPRLEGREIPEEWRPYLPQAYA